MSQNTVVVSGYGLKLENLVDVNNQLKLALKEIAEDYDLIDYCVTAFNKVHSKELFYGYICDDYEFDGDGNYIYFPDIKPYDQKDVLTKEDMQNQIKELVQMLLHQYFDEKSENHDELVNSAINENVIGDKCYDIFAVSIG